MEEFILAFARISFNYSISKVDEILQKFTKEMDKKKDNNNIY
jgi:hypothetical protein